MNENYYFLLDSMVIYNYSYTIKNSIENSLNKLSLYLAIITYPKYLSYLNIYI